MPYDDNLVLLSEKLGNSHNTITHLSQFSSYVGKPPVKYVNASPIKFDDIKQDFIASIAPKPLSFENFWQMIIDKRVSVIVMLTDLEEGGKKKSDQYWHDRDDEVMEIGSGISLKHVSSSYQGTFQARKV